MIHQHDLDDILIFAELLEMSSSSMNERFCASYFCFAYWVLFVRGKFFQMGGWIDILLCPWPFVLNEMETELIEMVSF